MTNLTTLEYQVLQMLLLGDDEALSILREQANQTSVSSRELTGVGFFTGFAPCTEELRIIDRPTFKLSDVNGNAENVKNGLGFVLFVTDGALSMPEGYTYDEPWPDEVRHEPWPDEVRHLVLKYSTGEGRDLGKLRESMRRRT